MAKNTETALERPAVMSAAELAKIGEFDESKALATGDLDDAFMTLDEFKAKARASNLQLRKIMRMKSGQSVSGFYLGAGPTIEMSPDAKTGVVRTLRTHAVQLSPRIIADLIGSHQLDRDFDGTQVGDAVMIAHLGQVETKGGFRVNNYHFLRPGRKIEDIIAEAKAAQQRVLELPATSVVDSAAPVQPRV